MGIGVNHVSGRASSCPRLILQISHWIPSLAYYYFCLASWYFLIVSYNFDLYKAYRSYLSQKLTRLIDMRQIKDVPLTTTFRPKLTNVCNKFAF